jgi:hypothetical protein
MRVQAKEWLALTKQERLRVLEYIAWKNEKAAVQGD